MADITETHDQQNQPPSEEDGSSVMIDLSKIYAFKPENLTIDITNTYYSNVSYLQVAPRDVVIDFLALPGIKKDEKMIVSGVRVYMTHVEALKMAEALGALLAKNEKRIERFEIPKLGEVELSTKIVMPSEEEQR